MKTESREFWVSDEVMKQIKDGYRYDKHLSQLCPHRITITYLGEPRKVTITEDEFDKLVDGVYASSNVVDFIKQRIFGVKEC